MLTSEQKEYHKRYYQENKHKWKNPETYQRGLEYNRQYSKKPENKIRARNNSLIWRYGITQQDYENMIVEQNSKCAICGTDNPRSKDNLWHIDHCHKTKKVRGLLCQNCNTGLGKFKDDLIILQKAVEYLKGE
jgi:hypothetical protein